MKGIVIRDKISSTTAFEKEIPRFLVYLATEKGYSRNTISTYAHNLKEYSKDLSSKNITPEAVTEKDIISHLKGLNANRLSSASVAQRISTIRSFHKYLSSHYQYKDDPSVNIESPKKIRPLPKVLSMTDVGTMLLRSDHKGRQDVRDMAIMELIYGCGLRISELINLRIQDLNRSQGYLRCMGKGNKERLIPVGNTALKAMEDYLTMSRRELLRGRQSDHIFITPRGEKFSRTGMWKVIKGHFKHTGISSRYTPHTLRHSFATHLLQGGADLRSVQEMLGHASVSTTQIYTHLEKNTLIKAHKKYHPRG